MNGRHGAMLLALAILAGLIGGTLSGRLSHVQAQQNTAPTEITAENFVVVDRDGKTWAKLGVTGDGKPVLRLYDESSKVIWSAGEVRLYPVR